MTEAIQKDGVVAAQKFARHKNINTTMIYNDAIEDIGGRAAARVALPASPMAAFVIRQVIACGRGHVCGEAGLGKLCLQGECAVDPAKALRRIRRRELRGDKLK